MEVIPVIDLKGGTVVHARLGCRDSYAPIVTPLARTSAPLDVVAGLLTLFPFRTIYVADLDAIASEASQDQALGALSQAFPDVTFWIDAGIGQAEEAQSWLARHPGAHLVLGSESLQGLAPLERLGANDRIILSLDFRGDTFLGPEALLAAHELWPRRVIVMTLARVGGNAGPDMDRLAAIAGLARGASVYAAGGLRGASDLRRLAGAGIHGVLVASALHAGQLTGADLDAAGEAAQGAMK